MTTALFDALRDGEFERLAISREADGRRALCSKPDDDYVDAHGTPALAEAIRMLDDAADAAGDVRRIECVYRRDTGLRFVHVRRTEALGPTVGPLRRLDLSIPEGRVLREACVAARDAARASDLCELGRGGTATYLHATQAPEHDRARYAQALAEELGLFGGVYWLDAGVGDDWARDAAKKGAPLRGAKASSSAVMAAHGAAAAVRAVLGAVGPRPDDDDETRPIVVVQGLGRVGAPLATRLATDGYRLVVSDKDYPRIDDFLGKLGPEERKNVSVVAPYQIVDVLAKAGACDVFCPAAEGGVLGVDALARIKCRAIAGPATALSDGASAEDEAAFARLLFERGVLYLPSWLVGAGGAVQAAFEPQEKSAKFDPRGAEARVERTSGWLAAEIIDEAKRTARPPSEVALKRASAIAGARP